MRPTTVMPIWFARVEAARPACFTPPQWALYLDGVRADARADSKVDKAMTAGAMPAYCDECTWKAGMQAAGQCHPPKGSA